MIKVKYEYMRQGYQVFNPPSHEYTEKFFIPLILKK